MKINSYYINALLADAAYVNIPDSNYSEDKLTLSLKNRMTASLAKFISDNFSVVNQYSAKSSGFDATVWRGNKGTPYEDQIFVSMRGTGGVVDGLQDVDLAKSGLGHSQIVDMVNWWLRLTTDSDKWAHQIKVVTVQVGKVSISYFSQADDVPGLGVLTDIGNVKFANGHSLGGYLATAFARIFGKQLPGLEVNTFNSAGFTWVAGYNIKEGFTSISDLIGGDYGLKDFSDNQKNFYAENGVNFTTNDFASEQKGERIPLFQEAADPIQTYTNHFMYKITDLLALGSMLEKLYPDLNIEILNSLVKTASNRAQDSYETVLDVVRKLLLGESVVLTPKGGASPDSDVPQPASRIAFHDNLAALIHSKEFTALVGKVRFVSLETKTTVASILSLVKGDDAQAPGYAYALKQLNAFAVLGADYGSKTAAEILDLFNPATGTGSNSEAWLKDRAAMLTWVIKTNNEDYQATATNPYAYLGR